MAVGGKSQAEVNCAWMDGRNKVVLWTRSSLPTSVAFSDQGSMIYWADTGEEIKKNKSKQPCPLGDLRWFPAGSVLTCGITVFLQVRASSALLEWTDWDTRSLKRGRVCSAPSHAPRTCSSGSPSIKVRRKSLLFGFFHSSGV